MNLFKIFRLLTSIFRPIRRRCQPRIDSEKLPKQFHSPPPTPSHEIVRHQNDLERIQALPVVKVEHVIDGDTLITSSTLGNYIIRLDSIDCPECNQEWGDISTGGLIKLVGGKSVRLESHGEDVYGRILGTLFVYLKEKGEWQNVNERMVTLGHAWVSRLNYKHLPISRQKKLNQLERWAKSKNVGLWKATNPIPPWQWRKSKA